MKFGGIRDHRGVKIFISRKPPDRCVIDEQYAVEHTVLAHQVFRRRDFLGLLFLVVGTGMGDNGDRRGSKSYLQHGAAWRCGQGHDIYLQVTGWVIIPSRPFVQKCAIAPITEVRIRARVIVPNFCRRTP